MFELAFIEQCADPGIEVSIVERFIATVGTDNPLAISITSGNRVILPEPPTTPEDAMRLIEQFVVQAAVRVGVTRYPAGHGITDVTELDPEMLDACENIRMGTELFGKVFRIVAVSNGSTDGSTFSDAIEAWATGMFEGRYVFGEADPGPTQQLSEMVQDNLEELSGTVQSSVSAPALVDQDPNKAGIRVDLTGIPGTR